MLDPASGLPREKKLQKCGILKETGAVYVVDQDLESQGTCFSVQADNITLDLNSHTIVYGEGTYKTAQFAILGIACWDPLLSNGMANGNPCGGSFNKLTIRNGRIRQASSVAPHSDAIHLGQGGGDFLAVRNVDFQLSASSSIPIFSTFSGAGSMVIDSTIENDVRNINNRHQLEGMSIKFQNSQTLKPGQTVAGNNITGGAQGGILLESAGATASRNKIRQNGRYSNDFSIYVWGNREEVFENDIDPASGRGIHIGGGAVDTNGKGRGGANSVVHNNRIRVVELKQNCDYSQSETACNVCQPGGAYGIQFDDNPQGSLSRENKVVAQAGDCDAAALRITDSRLSKNESQFDSFVAVRLRADSPGKAYGWDNQGPKGFTAKNDSFAGDTASYHVSWDGAENEVCVSCSFGKGTTNPSPDYVTFSFENGGKNPVRNIHFVDPKFSGGAGKDSTNMRPIVENNWPGATEYFIDWTLTVAFVDQNDKPVSGARLDVLDARGNISYSGNTQAENKIVLTEFRMFNTATAVQKDIRTPYLIKVSKPGCNGASDSYVQVVEPTTRRVRLTCTTQ